MQFWVFFVFRSACCVRLGFPDSRDPGIGPGYRGSQILFGKYAPEFSLGNRDIFVAPWPPPLGPGRGMSSLLCLLHEAPDSAVKTEDSVGREATSGESKGFGWELQWGRGSGGWGGVRRILLKRRSRSAWSSALPSPRGAACSSLHRQVPLTRHAPTLR